MVLDLLLKLSPRLAKAIRNLWLCQRPPCAHSLPGLPRNPVLPEPHQRPVHPLGEIGAAFGIVRTDSLVCHRFERNVVGRDAAGPGLAQRLPAPLGYLASGEVRRPGRRRALGLDGERLYGRVEHANGRVQVRQVGSGLLQIAFEVGYCARQIGSLVDQGVDDR